MMTVTNKSRAWDICGVQTYRNRHFRQPDKPGRPVAGGLRAEVRPCAFFTQPHQYSCGIDLHARMLYLRVVDAGPPVKGRWEGPREPVPKTCCTTRSLCCCCGPVLMYQHVRSASMLADPCARPARGDLESASTCLLCRKEPVRVKR